MIKLTQLSFAVATFGMLGSGLAQATLSDRGSGLLYDDVLNVTWLQDANFAKTSGYDDNGAMTRSAAVTWAANLVYGGYDDWRLASNTPVGFEWNENWSYDSSTDVGFNITSPHSELSYMYYVNLGLKGCFSTAAEQQQECGIIGNGVVAAQADVGLVRNLQSWGYWSGTEYALDPVSSGWYFLAYSGLQAGGYLGEDYAFDAWAVRPGDVTLPVSEPATYSVLLAGLGVLSVQLTRRRRSALRASCRTSRP